MKTQSLRFQVLAWYTMLLIAGFAAVGLFLAIGVEKILSENLRELIARRARQIAHLGSSAQSPITEDFLKRHISALYAPETPESNGRFVRVTTPNGNVLFLTGMPSDGSFEPKSIPMVGDEKPGFRTHAINGPDVIIYTARAKTPSGPIVIEVGASTAAINESVRQILLSLFVATPCLFGFAAVGAYFLVGRALRPMVRLAQSAEAITVKNLSDRLPPIETGDELEALSLALNQMIARLDESVQSTKRFLADASHELRTPLAALRGELEAVLSRKSITGLARETLASNLEEVERLGRIVQQLLALSRLESGETNSESLVFDLSSLTASASEQMEVLAVDKGVNFGWQLASGVFVRGDPARIKQALVNLLDNAISYTPGGGSVLARTLRMESRCILEVLDSGVGIPREALPHIFERFYRADKARSRDVGGAGLGLSIVQAICLGHNARIEVQSELGKGTTVCVSFPDATVLDGTERRAIKVKGGKP